ncbi:hypothetical protein ACOSQ4_012436 [Xanthoceras sorbifolium]
MSRERAMDYGDRAITSHGNKATRSSTSGHVEARGDQRESTGVSTSGDQGENKGVIPRAEKVDDPSLSISEELQSQAGDFLYPSSLIKREDLVGLAHTCHPSMGHRVLIPDTFTTHELTHPPLGYVAISSHHLIVGLRFPLTQFLILVLNLLELAPI